MMARAAEPATGLIWVVSLSPLFRDHLPWLLAFGLTAALTVVLLFLVFHNIRSERHASAAKKHARHVHGRHIIAFHH